MFNQLKTLPFASHVFGKLIMVYYSIVKGFNKIYKLLLKIKFLFEKLDAAKELAQNALDSFENREAAILHKAFIGELTAKWREENGVDLSEWEEKELGKLIKSGPQNGLYKPQTAYGEGNKIVRIDNFYEGVINPWTKQ